MILAATHPEPAPRHATSNDGLLWFGGGMALMFASLLVIMILAQRSRRRRPKFQRRIQDEESGR